MKRVFTGFLALALLTGCGQAGSPMAQPQALGAATASGITPDTPLTVNPDAAQERAIKKAKEWSSDARLVGAAWAMAKFELTSVVYHVFQSNKAGKLLVVESKLVSFWQKTHEISDKKLTLPARLLDTLDETYVPAAKAVDVARSHLPAGHDRPLSLLVLWKPNRFLPALYGVKADEQKVLIHAKSGKSLINTDVSIPLWPFKGLGEDEAAAKPAG